MLFHQLAFLFFQGGVSCQQTLWYQQEDQRPLSLLSYLITAQCVVFPVWDLFINFFKLNTYQALPRLAYTIHPKWIILNNFRNPRKAFGKQTHTHTQEVYQCYLKYSLG